MRKFNKTTSAVAAGEIAAKSGRGRKMLVPLATLAAAGALAVGSGADFLSTSANSASAVTAGTLTHTNSKANSAIFNVTNIKPGDTVNGDVKITNTGSLPSMMTLAQSSVASGFTAGTLTLQVTNVDTGATVYTGNFESMGSTPISLGRFDALQAYTFRFTVTLVQAATNTEQGKTASATFSWAGNQTANQVSNNGFADATSPAENLNP